MAVEAIVAGAVGAWTLYRCGLHVRYVRAYVQRRQRADEFERAFRRAREDIAGGFAYRLPGAGDRAALDALHAGESLCSELAACEFRVLGDLILQLDGKPPSGAVRALVGPAGTTCVLVFVVRATGRVMLRLASWAGDRTFITSRRPDASLAQPPTVKRAVLDAQLTCAEIVEQHRALAGDASLRAIASLDELLAELAAHHEAIARWRAAQPPDELLDADLRCVLGASYARSGKAWARRLRSKLPVATLRRA